MQRASGEPRALELVIGGGEHDVLGIAVTGYAYPDAVDGADGNWLRASVRISSGAFTGRFECFLRSEEFRDLSADLRRLTREPRGTLEFRTMEEQVDFVVTGDGLGHLSVRGHVQDRVGTGSRLAWTIELDQSHLPPLLAAVDAIVAAWPVRGGGGAS